MPSQQQLCYLWQFTCTKLQTNGSAGSWCGFARSNAAEPGKTNSSQPAVPLSHWVQLSIGSTCWVGRTCYATHCCDECDKCTPWVPSNWQQLNSWLLLVGASAHAMQCAPFGLSASVLFGSSKCVVVLHCHLLAPGNTLSSWFPCAAMPAP